MINTPSGKSRKGRSPTVLAMAVLTALVLSLGTFTLCIDNSSDADGTTVHVNTWGELQNALKNCGDYDVIILDSDIDLNEDSDEEEVKDVNNLTVDLNGHTIDGNHYEHGLHEGRFFHIGENAVVVVMNGTLTNGFDDDGGCAYVEEEGDLRFQNVNVINCGSSDDGAAIFVNGGYFVMNGGMIDECDSSDNAGAIYVNNGAYIELTDVQITNNHARGHGGAIEFTELSEGLIKNCTFQHDYCKDEGGALFIEDKSGVYLDNCKFIENGSSQGDHGGALYLNDAMMIINCCSFQKNEAGAHGGAIYAVDSDMQIISDGEHNDFTGNSSWESGGAMFIKGSSVKIKFADFKDNGAAQLNSSDKGEGGAIFIDDDSEVFLEFCTFIGNKAKTNGGGIVIEDDDNISLYMNNLVVIKDNKIATNEETFSDSNLVIRSDLRINCGFLTYDSEIWIALDGGERVFTSNFSTNNPGKDPALFFKSTDTNRYVAADPDSKEARLYGGSAGDMSDDNTIIIAIVAAVIVALVVVGGIVYFRTRKV